MGATLRGRDATRPVPDGPFAFLRIGDISQEGTLTNADLIHINPTDSINPALILRPGDVLFPNRGTRTTALAFPGSEAPTLVGSQFFILRPDPNCILPDFLSWFLRSETAHQFFDERRRGSYVQIIQRPDLAEINVPVPSMERQAKIVETAVLAQQERELSEKLTELRWHLSNQCLLEATKQS